MALADLTYKLYTNTGGTTLFTGTIELVHQTDLSDGSQDTVLYFMSLTADRTLKATSSPGVDQVALTPTDAIVDWTVATAYSLGDTIEPSTANTYCYVCTTAGTSHASVEPTWNTGAPGSTNTDGTVVWTLRGKRHEVNEIKLATTLAGLDTATAGAALNLGTSLASGSGNQIQVHVRVTNAVATVSNTTSLVDIGVNINNVQEEAV